MVNSKKYIPKSKKEIFIFLVFIETLAFTKAFYYRYFFNLDIIEHWNFSCWLISYDLRFIKRGLLGTLLNPLSNVIRHINSATIASSVGTLFLSSIIALFGTYFIQNLKGYVFNWLMVISFIIFPSGIANLYYGLGRYDTFLVIFILLSVYLSQNINSLNLLLIFILYILGIPTHEIHIFTAMPIFSFIIMQKLEKSASYLLFFGLINIISIFMLFLFSKPDLSTPQFASVLKNIALQEQYSLDLYTPAEFINIFSVIYTQSLHQNAIFFVSSKNILGYIYLLLTIIPLFILVHRFMLFMKKQKIAFITGIIMPLTLGFVAVDMGRWVTLSTINALVIAGLVLYNQPSYIKT